MDTTGVQKLINIYYNCGSTYDFIILINVQSKQQLNFRNTSALVLKYINDFKKTMKRPHLFTDS